VTCDKVTIAQEETIPHMWNGTMFGDLNWPLDASLGFVSISIKVRCEDNEITCGVFVVPVQDRRVKDSCEE